MPSVGSCVCHFDVKIKEFCNVHLGDTEIIQYPWVLFCSVFFAETCLCGNLCLGSKSSS